MEQDAIKSQLKYWLSREVDNISTREVTGLPISIASDVGNVRTENQDRAVVLRAQVSPNKFFVVGVLCDGMGGMQEGSSCAELAVASFISSCIRNRKLEPRSRLLQAVNCANQDVFKKYSGDGGATLSAFILDSDINFEAINVGDSRVYSIIGTELQQISVDDTIAGQLEHHGDPSQLSNKLIQFIGIGDDIEPHLLDMPDPLKISKMLLSSDGMHYINNQTMKTILSQNETSLELSKRLISVSNWCGGHDNSSGIVVSDLASLFSSPYKVQTGTVQIWDAYGDVSLIGIGKTSPVDNKHISEAVNNETKICEADEIKADIQESPSDQIIDKTKEEEKPQLKKKRKPKNKKEKEKEINITTETPQLKVNFDE
ncbi:MAG: serine/threonine protein phosphatase PrpC [Cocleimonas sp.]|jgi:serine/threonine protein phosphatase PrpC